MQLIQAKVESQSWQVKTFVATVILRTPVFKEHHSYLRVLVVSVLAYIYAAVTLPTAWPTW